MVKNEKRKYTRRDKSVGEATENSEDQGNLHGAVEGGAEVKEGHQEDWKTKALFRKTTVARIKIIHPISVGIGTVIPDNPHRVDQELLLREDGVLILDDKKKSAVLVPWTNVVEIVFK